MTDNLNIKMPPELLARISLAAGFYGEGRCDYIRRLIEEDLARLQAKREILNSMFGERDEHTK